MAAQPPRIVTVCSVNCSERHSAPQEQKYVLAQSSSVAKAARDLELRDCCSIHYLSTDHFTMAGASFRSCSRITVSLRRYVERVVRRSRTGIARDDPLRSRSVSDSGVGLPPQQTEQIFNAFFTTKPHGTGMGLRISRSIIESHGGRLWAADNVPRGASFCVTLPTKAEACE